MAKGRKNYLDAKGNYHNVENLTLAEIYLSGIRDGIHVAEEGIKAIESLNGLPYAVSIVKRGENI